MRTKPSVCDRAVHTFQVRRDVEQIFDYRFQRIGELFAAAAVEEPK
ncbi:MAG: hypothetical protein ABSH45_15810 [Bryobacteraceae bacterium]